MSTHTILSSLGLRAALIAAFPVLVLGFFAGSAAAQAPSEETRTELTAPPMAVSSDPAPSASASSEAANSAVDTPAVVAPMPPTATPVEPTATTAIETPPTTAPVAAAPASVVDATMAEARRVFPGQVAKSRLGAADRAALSAFLEVTAQPVWVSREGLTKRGADAAAEVARAADWGLDATVFDLPTRLTAGAPVEALAMAEVQIGIAVILYARHARGGRVDPSIISVNIDMRAPAVEPARVLAAVATAPDAGAALRGFHPRHDGFQRLQKALVDLRNGKTAPPTDANADDDKPTAKRGAKAEPQATAKPASRSDTEQRILVNMERWRWMPENLGAFHVVDNVPEQMARVYKDGKVVLAEKIVVGKVTQQTPTFSADMKYVIFHPTWGVPEGIKTNEIAPQLRRYTGGGGGNWFFGGGGGDGGASRVLARHQLKVSYNGRDVDPDSVDWSSADVRKYQFTQPPGARNVLGVVKFRFPNRHDVYMHDTPEKHLFGQSTRAFSHGCMRVQNPMRLAEVLLAHDKGWPADRVQSMLGRTGPIDVTLDKSIPVHIAYFTATVDDQGTLKTHGDLYGMDQRVASALAGRPMALAMPKPPAETPIPRETRKQKNDGAPQSLAREPFNPFLSN